MKVDAEMGLVGRGWMGRVKCIDVYISDILEWISDYVVSM